MKSTPFLIAIMVLLLLTSASDACPTCKLALENGADHSQQGYAYSIMFMLTMPFAIALGWTIFIVRCVIQQRKLEESGEAQALAFEGGLSRD